MPTTQAETMWIDLKQIDIPADARQHDPEKLAILAADMAAQGQLQEIVVASNEQRAMSNEGVSPDSSLVAHRSSLPYTVLAGAGRTLAARQLGWEKIRASVRQGVSEFDRARITFAENEDREDADAFYQAEQIAKMLKAKNCTQEQLAKELNVSEALVSLYLNIAKLPEAVRKFKRLNLGQLAQIIRLDNEPKQIDLANKTISQDLSVRQLKAIVDKLAGQKKRLVSTPITAEMAGKEAPPDPIQEDWEAIHAQTKGWAWSAKYPPELAWEFSVNLTPLHPDNPKKALGQWFLAMAEAFGETQLDHKTEKRVDVTNAVSAAYTDILRKIQDGTMEKEMAERKKNN